MIKPDKPWPRHSGTTDGCWKDKDRIEVPVRGWSEQSQKLPPPAPPPMRRISPEGPDLGLTLVILAAVVFGVFAGLAMAG